ncbi:hypothetical protein EOL70_15995 [Leucothrix sargassi]|nr:hypothetical protein EOL70_15995 [Leucothrix sargassi]
MIKKLTTIVLLTLCVSAFAKAETAADVAQRIVESNFSPEKLQPIVNSIFEREVYVRPGLKPYKSVFVDFYEEKLSSDEFKNAVAKINTDLFTLDELLALEKMMALPIFKKNEQVLPEYLNRISQLSIQVILANQFELQERLSEAQKNIPKEGLPKPVTPNFSVKSFAFTDESECPNKPAEAMVGTWVGEMEDKETGDLNKWTNIRKPNGEMLIEFETVKSNGVVDKFTEEGLWSYSGCLYTAVIKKIDGEEALFNEVYRVHELTDTKMRYSSYRVGREFTVTKVK